MRSRYGSANILTLRYLMDDATRHGIPFSRFSATMDEGECYWDVVSDPEKIIVTLSNLILCASRNYPGISPSDLFFKILFEEDPEENATVFLWKLGPIHEILEENQTLH